MANAPDWRSSSKEDILKQARVWHPQEDSWLRDRQHLSASERSHKSMDLYIQRSHDAELADLCGTPSPAVDEAPATKAAGLCAWITRSMPPLLWPTYDNGWESQYRAFFNKNTNIKYRKPNSEMSSWAPPPNEGCRHPEDHIIIAPPMIPVQDQGRCFLRSTPTFFRPRVGNSHAQKTRALLDNCANL